ncbi:CapA family protein [Metallumcola ferriviriculae]|uniref:CapA family protein n=1 Tax=Metallumcola ferriviriculae TaxID=3039180 RepID=A0AAU0UNC8_9FIRM|nr:CapA family protein [Desulfitibacteraceae bacterium MK1]
MGKSRGAGVLLSMIAGVLAGVLAAGLVMLAFNSTTWGRVSEEAAPVFNMEAGSPRVSLAAVGDIMLARKVGRLMEEKGNHYPVDAIAQRLAAADVTFGNLESPIGTGGTPLPQKGIWFRAKPERVEALVLSGFDAVSIANNHALDYDSKVFLDTLDILDQRGIKAVGGGVDIDHARKPVIIEKNGLSIGFLAYSEMADIIWSFNYPRMLMASEDTPGIAPAGPRYEAEILEDVEKLAPNVDIVVVSLHWGTEYQYSPMDSQRDFGHRLIDAGVDLIIGHHPHTLQGLERYGNGLIAYSLGNFIFDQNFSQQTTEGLLLEVTLTPMGVENATVSPVVIPQSQPRIAAGEDAARVNKLTASLSKDLGLDFEWQFDMPVLSLQEDSGMKI